MGIDKAEPKWTETVTHQQGARITCNIVSIQNDLGKEKLLAMITPEGITCFCKNCRVPHLVTRARCLAIWGIVDSRRSDEDS